MRNLKAYLILFLFTTSVVLAESIEYTIKNPVNFTSDENSMVTFSGITFHTEPTEPMLPTIPLHFLLPPDADLNSVNISFTANEEGLEGSFLIAPAPLEKTELETITPQGRTVAEGKDMAIYSSSELFPKSNVQKVQTGKLREYKLVSMSIFPYRYSPATQNLQSFKEATLSITYEREASEKGRATYETPQRTAALVKELAHNYDEMIGEYVNFPLSRSRNSGYVIITTSAIKNGSSQLNNFITSKKNRGFTVEVVTDLGSASSIRTWLQNNYQSKSIEYVLLIGNPTTGSGDVPMLMTHPWRETPTDFYYSDLSGSWDKNGNGKYGEQSDVGSGGIDFFSEVGVGRIPVYGGDYATLDKILAKTVEYENTPENEIAWRRKLMMAMKGYNAPAEGSRVGEAVKSKVSTLNSAWSYYRIYDDGTGGPELTGVSENFILYAMGMVETGFVIWMTHGSATDAHSVMSNNGATQWNKNKQAFVFCGSCLNAKPSVSSNLTYTLLKNGSIGAIGGTQTTLFSTGSSMENTGYNSAYIYQFSFNLAGKNMHVIDALNTVKASNPPSGNNLQNYMAFNLYGCPAIGIETNGSGVGINNRDLTNKQQLIRDVATSFYKEKQLLQISFFHKESKSVTVSLYSVDGKRLRSLVLKESLTGANQLSISTTNLPAGIYLLGLQSGNVGTLFTKVVLQ